MRARKIGKDTWANIDKKLDKSDRKSIDTLDQLFRESVTTYATRRCLGVRKILAVEYTDQNGAHMSNGSSKVNGASKTAATGGTSHKRVASKYVLDDKYTWFNYKEIEDIVVRLSAALVATCYDSIENPDGSRKLLICADTCMQWFLTAHACFRNNITVVTAYTTLDDDAILHSIQQTEVKILVVSQKFAHRVPRIISQAPLVDTIILLDDPLPGDQDEILKLRSLVGTSNVKCVISYKELIKKGSDIEEKVIDVPKANDIAVLMYTSGSTGKAKGVMLSHKSIVYTALSFSGPGDISHEDRYIGYLPLGHVLELAAECIFLRNGSTIAYSSAQTLTSSSPMIKKGQHGDAYIFKPTIMGSVPLVLDRIRSGVQQAIKSKGRFYDQLINEFVVNYKRYWWERYYDTPIMNRVLCKPFNMLLGGEIRAICSGGAALSKDTQEYLRYVCNFTVLQGYGLTETSAAASFCDVDERRCNVVGAPYPIVQIKLEPWSDYSPDDKPYPRGEIIIGGQPVSLGYYKMNELTRESFYVENGIRYFRTGDIGLMLPDGVLKIIDRKKDIVKPLSGEYISLSEIEIALRTLPIVENICVYCSQYSNYVVAIVKPDFRELKVIAKQLFTGTSDLAEKFRRSATKNYASEHHEEEPKPNGTNELKLASELVINASSHEFLSSNKWLVEHTLKLLQAEGHRKQLKRTQIPSKIRLVVDEWTPESGMVTASFKLRRREIERKYAEDIKQLYAELGQKIDQNS